MVAIRFFRNGEIIGVKEFIDEDKAMRIGEAWLKRAKMKYPVYKYYFELVKFIYILEGKAYLDGTKPFKQFKSLAEFLTQYENAPNVQMISRTIKCDESFFIQGKDKRIKHL